MSHRNNKLVPLAALLAVAAFMIPFGSFTQATPKKEEKLSRAEKKRQKAAREESESAYKHWIDDEVPYIITPDERSAWKKLSTDAEREQFIETFWERRNPNPQSGENEFKEEYYRRIAYANEHYASGIPGWKTDRGRIYIMYGPPDEVDAHPSGGTYNRPMEEGGGMTSTYPFETWRYRYIDGIGNNIILEFVDPSQSGEYHMTMDPGEKDALLHVPGAGLTLMEEMGMSTKADRFTNTDGTTLGKSMGGRTESMEEFTRLDLYSKIWKPPSVKFNDLRAVVTSKLTANLLPFDVHTDFVRIAGETVLTPITIQVANKDLQFQNKDGIMHAVLDIYGELTTISGRLASRFEDSVVLDVPQEQFQKYVTRKSVYQKALPLHFGAYKLNVVVKDDSSGHLGSIDLGVRVPKYLDDQLSNSSLILADLLMPIPTNQVGTGPFVIGSTKVRPSVDQIFTRDQTLNIYMQVYNLGMDPQSHRPSLDVQYQITKDGKPLLDQPEDAAKWAQPVQQITLEKQLPLKSLTPGKYSVLIKVTDNVRKQTISPTATFELR
jgi:GWxTD domain-containing protein